MILSLVFDRMIRLPDVVYLGKFWVFRDVHRRSYVQLLSEICILFRGRTWRKTLFQRHATSMLLYRSASHNNVPTVIRVQRRYRK